MARQVPRQKSIAQQCTTITHNVLTKLDAFTQKVLSLEEGYNHRHHRSVPAIEDKNTVTRLLNPEQDVRQLLVSTQSLADLWQFFEKRLNRNNDLALLCLTILDDSQDFVRVKYLSPLAIKTAVDNFDSEGLKQSDQDTRGSVFEETLVSFSDGRNHLIQAFERKDTTFTSNLFSLGTDVANAAKFDPDIDGQLNLFTVPFIADDRAVATLTLGFTEVDSFSQAKLSYLYTLRDQVAQLMWNLILKERMQFQAQMDSLTGLITHSTFQQVLGRELKKSADNESPLTTMLIGLNNLAQVNQDFGHDMGDEVICGLASTIRRLIRGLDTVARYSGDEIAIILPETDVDTADTIAERFLQGIKDLKNPVFNKANVILSLGYSTYPSDAKLQESLLKQTEQALHLAKFRGDKTGGSTKLAYRSAQRLNDKTILEVFASHVAKKYDGHRLYQQLTYAMEEAHQDSNHTESDSANTDDLMLQTIGSLAGALDAKDKYTRGHSQAVANYAVALAHALQMTPEEVEQVRLAAFLHDIGKIGIPESILCKDGPLNEREWEIMKQHPVIGAQQILAPVKALKDVIPLVEYHHENWNGTGYPEGLAGEDIPLGARIVAIVDAFHGLTSDRSYRKALPIDQAADMLKADAGVKWDPELLAVFLKILNIATPKRAEGSAAFKEASHEASPSHSPSESYSAEQHDAETLTV